MSHDAAHEIACAAEPAFAEWLASADGSVAITTYQGGKLALVGWTGTRVGIHARHFTRPMGMAVSPDGQRLALATQHELMLFANAPLLAGDYLEPGTYDALFLPRVSYFTGPLNLHDMAWDRLGRLWVVNTRFSCLMHLSAAHSFEPAWQPGFISMLAPEDRCHLNGLAMADGRPRYATALGRADEPRGWHPGRFRGGVLIDIDSGELIQDDLCMPHSPRWHASGGGRLFVLNSGLGELCVVDPATRKREVVCALPGYARGLAFVGDYALIGLSKVREKYLFEGLPLQHRFPELTCGVAVVDLRSGAKVGLFEFTAGAEELYDVQFIPAVRRGNVLSREKTAWRQAVTAPDFAYWLPPERAGRDEPPAGGDTGEPAGAAEAVAGRA